MDSEISAYKKFNRYIDAEGRAWKTTHLIWHARHLEPFDYDLSQVNIDEILFWQLKTMRDFLVHLMRVNDSDLNFPIILNSQGRVMDGMHRIVKAKLEGRSHIPAVRFKQDPPHDYIEKK